MALSKQSSLEVEKDRVSDFWYATETMSSGHRRVGYSLGRRICEVLGSLQVSWRNIGQEPVDESAHRPCKEESS